MSSRSTTVRPAEMHDIMEIVATIERARELSPVPLPPAEYPFAMQYTLDLIGFRQVWVVEVASRVVGCAMVAIHHWPWSRHARFMDAIHFWVEPEFRSGGAGLKLLEMMKVAAEAEKLPLRVAITYPDGDARLKDRLMQMQGFTYIGGSFWCNKSVDAA